MQPRTEQVPLTIDAQYVVGFNWTRNAQLRLVKLLGDSASVGISFESPQAAFTGRDPGHHGGSTTPGGSLLNSTTNYSIDFAPDVIAKFAFDPGFGHYEIYGLGRGFRDRYEPTAGSVAGSNNTTWGGGVGAGLIMPLASSPFYFQASGLVGDGIGRYGSAQLPDATVRAGRHRGDDPRGPGAGRSRRSSRPRRCRSICTAAWSRRDARRSIGARHASSATATSAYNNSGCDLLTGTAATCVGNTQSLRQLILGDWWKVYQGTIGNFQIGLQYSYTDSKAFTRRGRSAEHQH